MGLEPTTLRDLVGCSNHWATGDSMVSEGQFVGLDWNRIARLHSQVLVSTFCFTFFKLYVLEQLRLDAQCGRSLSQ